MSRPAALERRLGHPFADRALLEQALTHRSCGPRNYERLEFLGDGVLGCAVADELYARFPQLSEGKLTRLRASLVREEALVEVAGSLRLADHLRFAPNVELTASMLADGVEALFGALFLDGGYQAARQAAVRVFGRLLEKIDPDQAAKDAKTQLQEMLQSERRPRPEYRVIGVEGAPHRQSFEVECSVAGRSSVGHGTSRQRAEQQAAKAMLEKLQK